VHAVSEHPAPQLTRYLPQVAVATTLVAALPVAIVWELRAEGVVSSPWACLGLAMVLSIAASSAGCAYWVRRPGSGDILFSELLVWGWLWRLHAERTLTKTTALLGLASPEGATPPGALQIEDKTRLLRQLAAALEAQDPFTNGHSRRVARHAAMIAHRMGLPREQVAKIRAAAAIHDVGKLHVPTEILNKPGRLTDEEFAVVKLHPTDGAEMVSVLGDAELTEIVRHHHERLDGNGYPDGLAGDQIPLGARIIAVADTFDAITSVRPYRPAAAHKKALDVIAKEAGSQLDPAAVRAFLSYYSGKRPIVVWSILMAVPQRVLAVFGGEASAAVGLSAGRAIASAVAVVAVGGAAVSSTVAAHSAPLRAREVHWVRAASPVGSGDGAAAASVSARRARSSVVKAGAHRSSVRRRRGRAAHAGGAPASPTTLVSTGGSRSGSAIGGSTSVSSAGASSPGSASSPDTHVTPSGVHGDGRGHVHTHPSSSGSRGRSRSAGGHGHSHSSGRSHHSGGSQHSSASPSTGGSHGSGGSHHSGGSQGSGGGKH